MAPNQLKVSKLMTDEYADQEIVQAKLIDSIDVNLKYHLKTPEKCIPQEIPPEVLIEMSTKEIKFAVEAMLVYDYGGVTWNDFSKDRKLQVYHVTDFLKSAQNIVDGVKEMLEKEYIHGDLKVNNLLYNHVQQRCNMIDFGHSGKFEIFLNVERPSGNNNKWQNQVNWWFPHTCPEKKYQYKEQFFIIRELLKSNSSECVINFTNSDGAKTYKNFLLQDEYENEFAKDVEGLFEYLSSVAYETFLKETLQKLDTYYVAFSLVCTTFNFIKNPSFAQKQDGAWLKLVNEIRALALQASRIDPRKRPTAESFAKNYSEIITNFNCTNQKPVGTQKISGNGDPISDEPRGQADRESLTAQPLSTIPSATTSLDFHNSENARKHCISYLENIAKDYNLSFVVYKKQSIPATHSLCMFDKTCNNKMPAEFGKPTSPLILASLDHRVVVVLWPLPLLVAWVWDLQHYIETKHPSNIENLLQIIFSNLKNSDGANVELSIDSIQKNVEGFEIVSFTAPERIDTLLQSINEPPNTPPNSAMEVRAWLRLTYVTTLTLISVYSWYKETEKSGKLVTSVANLIRDHVAIRLSQYVNDNDLTRDNVQVDVVDVIKSSNK